MITQIKGNNYKLFQYLVCVYIISSLKSKGSVLGCRQKCQHMKYGT